MEIEIVKSLDFEVFDCIANKAVEFGDIEGDKDEEAEDE